MRGDHFGTEGKIDEPCAGDFRRRAEIVDLEVIEDALRDRAGILPQLFRQHHRGVGLVIAEARIGRAGHVAGWGQASGG